MGRSIRAITIFRRDPRTGYTSLSLVSCDSYALATVENPTAAPYTVQTGQADLQDPREKTLGYMLQSD